MYIFYLQHMLPEMFYVVRDKNQVKTKTRIFRRAAYVADAACFSFDVKLFVIDRRLPHTPVQLLRARSARCVIIIHERFCLKL